MEQYGEQFLRIEAIAKIDDDLKMLDMKISKVREGISAATNASTLYRGELAERY